MRLAVFGATGGTGRALVEQARAAGHEVAALARDPARLGEATGVRVVRGDVRDPAAVAATVEESEAVVCCLGTSRVPAGDRTHSEGTARIVEAMVGQGVRRLVVVSAFGVGESRTQASFVFARVILPLFVYRPFAYEDKARQEAVVRASDLDWTIVRPTHLIDAPSRGRTRVLGARGRFYERIARGDVAAFLLDEVAARRHVREAVAIAWD